MSRQLSWPAFAATASIAAALLATLVVDVPRRLIWNRSASVPVGLYLALPVQALRLGELVVAMPPPALASFMARRRYLGAGVPMLKLVAALPGQTVCRSGLRVRIDGRTVALAHRVDRRSRPLPVWNGCHRIAANEVFLLNADVADSFDGRYFGVLARSTVVGRAVPLWTWRRGA